MKLTSEKLNKKKKLAFHYTQILKLLGEDPTREGLLKTPNRIAEAMIYLTKGYTQDSEKILSSAIFIENYKQMVIVKNIDFFSLCEHHLLPFFGKAHIAYIPNNAISGLSKILRIVNVYARQLQIQERMTIQIKNCIQKILKPLGVIVVIEAKHMCLQMRGIKKQNSITTTFDFTGAFNQIKIREEFFNFIKINKFQ